MATIYHANFRSQAYRPSRPSNAIRFCAASDGAATAVATELGNWTTGKLTSLTKNVGGVGYAGPYPVGTRVTCQATVADATGAVSRVTFRNVLPTLTEADVVALLTGVVGSSGIGATFSALGAPPNVPGSGSPITAVLAVKFLQKS